MKKYIKYSLVIILLIIVLFLIVVYFAALRFPTASLNILESKVDNSYNNYLAGGNVCRVNNALYYNYYKSNLNYGLAEITVSGTKRIYWNGRRWFEPGFPRVLSPIKEYDDKIYLTDNNEYYDPKKGNFISDETLPADFRCTNYGLVYVDDKGVLCLNNGGTKQTLLSEYSNAYITNNAVYYITDSSLKQYDAVRELDLKTNKDTEVAYISSEYTEYIGNFYVENGYAIFDTDILNDTKSAYTQGCIYKVKLGQKNRESEVINNLEECYGYNLYNGKVYFSQTGKLMEQNLDTSEAQILCEKETITTASEVYIIDDTWVYFTDNNSTLWRVSNDGEKTEKVFG